MNTNIENFHKRRRAFIILPRAGLLLAEPESVLSHKEILLTAGFSSSAIKDIMIACPRGYFLDNTLVIYQGDNIKEGGAWELQPQNFSAVKNVFEYLECILGLNSDTKIYLGVKCGKLGAVWEQYNQVNIEFFR